mmetsp:Transcript_19458/g.45677  ORF Transcript_19458/g.45677 Transcript_19458/m.45677 type:complete len:207 (-) Transcript_19458:713-1333(-)
MRRQVVEDLVLGSTHASVARHLGRIELSAIFDERRVGTLRAFARYDGSSRTLARLAVALDPLPKARLTRHCSQNRLMASSIVSRAHDLLVRARDFCKCIGMRRLLEEIRHRWVCHDRLIGGAILELNLEGRVDAEEVCDADAQLIQAHLIRNMGHICGIGIHIDQIRPEIDVTIQLRCIQRHRSLSILASSFICVGFKGDSFIGVV